MSKNIFYVIALLLLFAYPICYFTIHPLTISTDAAMYLAMGELILDGKVPYRDFIEFNFPLIMYVSCLPVLIQRAVPLPLPQIFSYFSIAIEIISFLSCLALCQTSKTQNPDKKAEILAMLAGFTLFNQSVVAELGQREHLFCLCFSPYIFARLLNHEKTPLLATSVIAGLALALKPQFLLLFIAFELAAVSKPANTYTKTAWAWTLGTITLTFLPLLLLPADALKTFFLEAIPVYAGGIDWGSNSFIYRLASPGFMHTSLLAFLSLLLALPLYRKSSLIAPIATLVLAALALYIAGGQAWTYRYLPCGCFSMVLLFQTSYLYTRKFKIIGITALSLISIISLCRLYLDSRDFEQAPKLTLSGLSQNNCQVLQSDLSATALAMLKLGHPGEKAIYIGTGCNPGYPSQLQAGLRPGSRYLFSMLAQVETCINKGKSVPFFERIKGEMIENYGQDILSSKPSLIFIQDWPMESLLGTEFHQKFMSNYKVTGKLENCSIWGLASK